MRPLKLTLNAFGPFASKQEIDFMELNTDEIFLVTGETGAGKTTIFDAMSFALYGKASGDSRAANSFKSDHAPQDEPCWVEFEFSLHGRKYKLRRTPAQVGLKRDGGFKELSPSAELILPDGGLVTGATAVTERIEEILGLDHRQFKQTMMLAQGEFKKLIEADGREKQRIFSTIFGTSAYSRFTELLSREESDLQRLAQSSQESIARCIRELGGYGHTALLDESAQFLPYSQVFELVTGNISLHEAKCKQLDEDIAVLEKKKSKLDPERMKALNEKLERRDELRGQAALLSKRKDEMAKARQRLDRLEAAVLLFAAEEVLLSGKSRGKEYSAHIEGLKKSLDLFTEKEQILFASKSAKTPKVLALEAGVKECDEHYERLYRAFLNGQAGVLAAKLAEGELCPVCGSRHHPAPAELIAGTPLEKDVNEAKTASVAAAKALASKLEQDEKAYWQAKSDREKCAAQLEAANKHLDEMRLQYATQRDDFKEKLNTSSFSSYEDYRAALAEKAELAAIKHMLEQYEKDRAVVGARLAELEQDTLDYEKVDIDALIKENDELTRQLSALRETKTELYAVLQGSKKRLDELAALHSDSADLSRRYAIARELSALAKGSRTVSFERYILASYFDDIIKLANIHLQRMTSSRYRLRRREDKSGLPQKGSGLDMEIIDGYTGKTRDVSTLSGGESFKASLSLALGLSGIVQIYSGGVSIETMFIDEGFGSLDEKSLDSAVETLFSLKNSGRMVGVISHVPGLRGYIHKKLSVRYSPTGSSVGWI